MIAEKILTLMPVLSAHPDMDRRPRELMATFATLCVMGLEVYLGSVVGFTKPFVIVSMVVLAATLLLSAWQTDLTRRPSSVFGAVVGSMSCNSVFMLALGVMTVISGKGIIPLILGILGIVAGFIGFMTAICCLDLFVSSYSASKKAATRKQKAVIIPGKVLVGSSPQWQLSRRCWKAVEYLEEDPSLLVICCGGVSKDKRASDGTKEAEVMRNTIESSLQQRGHSDVEIAQFMKRVLEEGTSTTTQENFSNLAKIFDKIGFDYKKARFGIITADYHVKRAVWNAHKAGFMRVNAIPVKTQWDTAFIDWNQELYIQMRNISRGENYSQPVIPKRSENEGERKNVVEEEASRTPERSPSKIRTPQGNLRIEGPAC